MRSPADPTSRASNSLATAGAADVHLPVQLTRFIGREREIATVRDLLGTSRVLTLTGAGGSGKTRLALEVAARVGEQYPDGVAWVELASLTDTGLLLQHVAAPLGIRGDGTRPLLDAVLDALGEQSLLLGLDNCEHLVDACAPLVEALLRSCPRLRILATSREALGVPGERAWLVPALSLPPRQPSRLADVAAAEAAQLFLERARDVLPAFDLGAGNAAAIASICRRLEGIPLAIELAAARVRVLTPEQILQRLDNAFGLLTGGSRSAPPRHKTLRAAVDWSYDLLRDEERLLLQRLSVFVGGFTLELAESVCAGEGIEAWDVLDLIAALVEKSLLVMQEQRGAARYHLLETIRHYAQERLAESGALDRFRRRHAESSLALAEEHKPVLGAGPPTPWMQRLQEEHDNLRAALGWLLEQQETESAARLASMLLPHWCMQTHMHEGRRWFRDILAIEAPLRPRTRARTLYGAGLLAMRQFDWQTAEPLLEESLAIFRELDDREWLIRVLACIGFIAIETADHERAETIYEEILGLTPGGAENPVAAPILNNLAMIAEARGDSARAVAYYEHCVAAMRQMTNAAGIALAVGNLGRALRCLLGDRRRAEPLFRESLRSASELGEYHLTAYALADLGELAAAAGKPDRGARLFAAAETLFASIGMHMSATDRQRYDADAAAVRERLGASAWERLSQEGAAMPPSAAVEYALSEQLFAGADAAPPHPTAEIPTPGPSLAAPAAGPAAPAVGHVVEDGVLGLRVLALGPLQVHLEGQPLPASAWAYAKPRELLLYLLSHPQGRTREQIGLVFWPDASAAQVKNSFHVTLHHLRKTLGSSDWIVFQEERYRINPELGCEFDAALFEEQLTAALRELRSGAGTLTPERLASVLGLYRGDFLEDESFGDWHLETRDHLQRLWLEGMLALGELLVQAERWVEGAEVYQRIVRREDLHEEAHRRLMLCWAQAGERSRALKHYERLVTLLREELDAEPEEETTELFQQLRQSTPA